MTTNDSILDKLHLSHQDHQLNASTYLQLICRNCTLLHFLRRLPPCNTQGEEPKGNIAPGFLEPTKPTEPELSEAEGSVHVTLVAWLEPRSVDTVRFAGQFWMSGSSVSDGVNKTEAI